MKEKAKYLATGIIVGVAIGAGIALTFFLEKTIIIDSNDL